MNQILVNLVLSETFKWLVAELGLEDALLVAIAYVLISKGKGAKELLTTLPTVTQVLTAVNGLVNLINIGNALELENINNELGLLAEENEAFQNAVETANELLDVSGIINPAVFMDSTLDVDFNESPDDFYLRTVHSGNVGAVAIEALSHYVTLMLKLPEPEYNLNGATNGIP